VTYKLQERTWKEECVRLDSVGECVTGKISHYLWRSGEHSAEFALYGLLGRDAAYCGTDLSMFRWNFLAPSNLVEISRPLEARSASRFNYHEYVGGTVQR